MSNLFLVLSVILMFYHQTSGYSSEDNVKGSTEFSFNMYRELYDQKENLIVSPYSFRILLGVLYQTSFGSTESELKEKVHLGEKASTLATYKSVIDHFTSSPNVKVANKLYLKHGLTLNPSFKTIVSEYKSETELIDFSVPIKAVNIMNQWVEDHTNALIKNLVTEDMVHPTSALFIINALYFKAKWNSQFKPEDVEKLPFHGYDKESSIDFMSNKGYYGLTKSDEFKVEVVELPYTRDSNFVFWILLPFQDSNLEELKSHLNHDFINNVNATMTRGTVDLQMPIFEIESAVDGVKLLKKMGIEKIFTKSEMKMLDDDSSLSVGDVRHKAKITVNTEGTEAAAATVIGLLGASFMREPPPVVHVDRPFIYMIMTDDTKEPVFVGHFVKP